MVSICTTPRYILQALRAGRRKARTDRKALGESGNPEFATVMRIVRALGLTLSARPAEATRTPKKRRVA